MIRGRSLARRLALIISLGFLLVWTLATLAMALVLKSEQEELLNLTLRETAVLFQPVLSRRLSQGRAAMTDIAPDTIDTDEALVYVFLDAEGTVLLRSAGAIDADLPPIPPTTGLATTASHTFYTTGPDAAGHVTLFGDPNEERWEAYRDSLLAFLLPMLALLVPMYLLVGWSARVLGALALGDEMPGISSRLGDDISGTSTCGAGASSRSGASSCPCSE